MQTSNSGPLASRTLLLLLASTGLLLVSNAAAEPAGISADFEENPDHPKMRMAMRNSSAPGSPPRMAMAAPAPNTSPRDEFSRVMGEGRHPSSHRNHNIRQRVQKKISKLRNSNGERRRQRRLQRAAKKNARNGLTAAPSAVGPGAAAGVGAVAGLAAVPAANMAMRHSGSEPTPSDAATETHDSAPSSSSSPSPSPVVDAPVTPSLVPPVLPTTPIKPIVPTPPLQTEIPVDSAAPALAPTTLYIASAAYLVSAAWMSI